MPLDKLKAEMREISGQIYVIELGIQYLQTEGVKLNLLAVPAIALRLLNLKAKAKVLRTSVNQIERLIAEASCPAPKN